ncbi:DNA alkylation repair protein [Paenibacillus guangzhouensis]|uniref:DNA alkylation repair protein n=1 Tax=Paenibacillus guangzhouensis TaxID=1473112 RepID=UPI001266A9B5|nr:DNA alkylation repair protein [Paenibacillus guangzhouensis]
MAQTIRQQLLALAEEPYRQFASALLPNIDNVLGVRLPELRKIARRIVREDWRAYLDHADNDYFEDIMLQGMVIGYLDLDIEEILRHIANFVPKINNWSVCDSFCAGLKITKTHRQQMWDFLQPYLASDQEYDIRFAVVMLLTYYVEEDAVFQVLQRLSVIHHEGYYVKMAVAWAVSICYVKFPALTMTYLTDPALELDDFTFNKALQKMTESHRVDTETKQMIRKMKRK